MDSVGDRMSHPVLTIRPDERLDIARALMHACRYRHLAVVDGDALVGVLSLGDVLAAAPLLRWPDARARAVGLRELAVAQAMRHPVVTIAADAPLDAAAALMERRRVGCLPVVDGAALRGILTRTDLLREAIADLERRSPPPTVAWLMTPCPLTVGAQDSLDLAQSLMKAERVRHLPVVEGERVIGMLSQHDVLAAVGEAAPLAERHTLLVGEVMSSPAVQIGAERRAAVAARLLCHRRLGALPVVRAGRLVGIVTTADFFHHLASLSPPAPDAGAERAG
jgi:CBS domain-containing protein